MRVVCAWGGGGRGLMLIILMSFGDFFLRNLVYVAPYEIER